MATYLYHQATVQIQKKVWCEKDYKNYSITQEHCKRIIMAPSPWSLLA